MPPCSNFESCDPQIEGISKKNDVGKCCDNGEISQLVLSKSQKQRRSSIGFHPQVLVHRILHKNNYTDAETKSTWYNCQDYQRIKSDVERTLEMMQCGRIPFGDGNKWYCSRGLEDKTPMGITYKLQNRRQAREAVLSEQTKQGRKEAYNPGMIAFVYEVQSRHTYSIAHQIALNDEKNSKR